MTFKFAQFLKCDTVYKKAKQKKNYELVCKAEIRAEHFATVSHFSLPPTPEIRQEQNHSVSKAHPSC